MKTFKAVSSLLVSAFLFTACTPQDKAVVNKPTREKLQSKKGGRPSTSPATSTDFTFTNYSLSIYLLERQNEAIELLKATIGTLPENNIYKVEETTKDGEEPTVSISSFLRLDKYEAANGPWKTSFRKNYTAKFEDVEDSINLEIEGTNISASADSLETKGVYVNLRDQSYSLKALSDENGQVTVKVEAAGFINGAKAGGRKKDHDVSLEMTLVLDRESLNAGPVKILKSDIKMFYPGKNVGSRFSMTFQGTDLTLDAQPGCHKLIGKGTAKAGTTIMTPSMDGENAIVNGKWTKKLAECGQRPVVDLGRLQVF